MTGDKIHYILFGFPLAFIAVKNDETRVLHREEMRSEENGYAKAL